MKYALINAKTILLKTIKNPINWLVNVCQKLVNILSNWPAKPEIALADEPAVAVKGCNDAVLAASAAAYERAPAVKCCTNCS